MHPNTECMQTTPAIYGDGYRDGLEEFDKEGMVSVPNNPGVGVEWDRDALKSLTTCTRVID